MADRIKGITVEIGGDTKGLNKALSATNRTINNTQSELRQVERLLKLDPKNTELLKQKQDLLSKAVEDTGVKLEALKQAKGKADADMANGTQINEEQYRKLQREITKTQTDLDTLAQKSEALSKVNLAQSISAGASKVSQTAGKISSATKPITLAVAGAAAAAVAAMDAVDEGLDTVAQKTGATGEEAKGLEAVYRDVAAKIPGSFGDIGAAVGELNTRLNFTGDTLRSASEQFLKFAKINNMDVNSSVQLVTRAMGDASIPASEYSSVLDALTVAGQKSGISMDTLTTNLAKYGAPMRALGVGTQEAIAMFAGWEKAGVNTEIAFSGMKKAISNWGAAGKDSTQEFKKTLEAIKACPDIASATSKAIEVFGAKAGPDLADAIKSGRFEVEEYTAALANSGGAVDSTYGKIVDEVDDSKLALQNLQLGVHDLGETMAKSLGPVLLDIAGKTSTMLEWFNGLDKGTQNTILTIIGIIAAISPVAGIISKISSVISIMSGTVIPALSKALSFLMANPIVLAITAIVIAVTALVAGFIYLWKNCEGFRNFWIDLWEKIKTVFNTVIDFIKNNWKGLLLMLVNPFVGAFKLLYDNCAKFREFIDNFVARVKGFFINAWNSIVVFFTETIPQWIANIVNWFNSLPEKIGYALGRIVGFFIQLGVDAWNWITVELPKIIQGIIQWFATLPERIGQWFTATIAKISAWGTQAWDTAVAWTSKLINDTVEWFATLPERMGQWLSDTIEKIKAWGKEAWDTATAWASKLINDVVDWFKSIPEKMLEVGKNIITGLWDGIVKMKEWLKEKVSGFFGGFVDGIKDSLQICSPSRLIANEVGAMVPPAIPIGFKMTMPAAIKKVQGLMGIIAQSFTLPKLPVLQSTAMPLPKLQTAASGAAYNNSPDYSGLLDNITAAVQNAVGTHGHSISLDSKVMVSQLTPGVSAKQGDTMAFSVRRS